MNAGDTAGIGVAIGLGVVALATALWSFIEAASAKERAEKSAAECDAYGRSVEQLEREAVELKRRMNRAVSPEAHAALADALGMQFAEVPAVPAVAAKWVYTKRRKT